MIYFRIEMQLQADNKINHKIKINFDTNLAGDNKWHSCDVTLIAAINYDSLVLQGLLYP
jgi:hypothetical protein